MPLCAVIFAGQESVRLESIKANVGLRNGLRVLTLTCAIVSVSTAEWDTSLPVPAVVGMAMRGIIGPGTLPNPKKSRARPPCVKTTATIFAISKLLPPPIPITESASLTRATSIADSATSSEGSGSPPVKTEHPFATLRTVVMAFCTCGSDSIVESITITGRCNLRLTTSLARVFKLPRPKRIELDVANCQKWFIVCHSVCLQDAPKTPCL